MRDILAFSTSFNTWDGSVAYATDLAARLDGALTGTYVHPSPLYMMPPYASPDLLEAVIENAREIERIAHASESSFVAWAKSLGVRRALWQVAEGHVPETLAHIGNWHDLLVIGRSEKAPWGAPADLGTLVLRTHLPCIVVPPARTSAELARIALAWNGTVESLRAIHAALPLLRHASQVTLLEGARRDPDVEIGWSPRFDVEVHLRNHGIDLRRITIEAADADADAGGALLAAAARVGADLLVMGAYGRARVSEWAFGGATRKVLADATLPVFFRH